MHVLAGNKRLILPFIILHAAFLPGFMGVAEVGLYAKFGELIMIRELGSVIMGECFALSGGNS